MLLYLDTETFSTVPINRGLDRYFTGAECLIVTYAVDDGPVQCWDVTLEPEPAGFRRLIHSAEKIVAHNVQFDKLALQQTLGIETAYDKWHCTMARAYAHSLPGSLEALGPVLGLPLESQKLVHGKKLIQLFCSPDSRGKRADSSTHPDDWSQFIDYAVQDTAALREVYKRLPVHNYTGEHYSFWLVNQAMNERGFFVDQDLCRAALKIRDEMSAELNAEIERLTDGAITRGTQRERILHHLVGEQGFIMLDMTADSIKQALEGDLPPETRRLLELRRDSSLTSLTKYQRALEQVGVDGRMRYTIQFSGADRTGRNAGRGFQPHNMPRPKREADEVENVIIPAILDGSLRSKVDNVNDACKDALRGTIIAAPGNELFVGDWSNIEGRVLAWLAGERWKLKAFEDNDKGDGPDVYVLLYASSFGISVDLVAGKQRQIGKGMELSLGFGGGVGAFFRNAVVYGLDLDELGRVVPTLVKSDIQTIAERNWRAAFVRGRDYELEPSVYMACDALKQVWRRQHPATTQLWWDLERAVTQAIEHPTTVHHAGRCKIFCTGAWLVIELPSGRRLLYAQPRCKPVVEHQLHPVTGETVEKLRTSISYMAANGKRWQRVRTYAGKLAENITQAVSNDVLRAAELRIDAGGYPIILDVHDEVVAEVPAGLFNFDEYIALMEQPLPWSEGLPLKAAGFVSTRYRKD